MGHIISSTQNHWPGNRVPFVINNDDFLVGTSDRQAVEDAIGAWNRTEKVRLVPRLNEPDYIVFRREKSGCHTDVGRQGGEQSVFCAVGSGGFTSGSIMHEIGHVLGLFHEHQRRDRNDYVSVDSSVETDVDYRIPDNGRAINAYDCDSIMHYRSITGEITSTSTACASMGQRISPSKGDIASAAWLLSSPWGAFCGMGSTLNGRGYWLVESKGGVLYYGEARYNGSMGGVKLNKPVTGMAVTPSGDGYWLVAKDGGVFSFGDASFHGSMADHQLNASVCGMAATASGNGYWLVAEDGGVFTLGDAPFHGSMGGEHLNAPVCGMAMTPSGNGYWLVAKDGGVFSFGDASFHGSMADHQLNAPVCGMASTPSGNGYWLVAEDGGVFTLGDAPFHGSMGGEHLNAPVCGMASIPSGNGYWLVAQDGGVFSFGDAPFFGSGVG